jgi:tetratricopeptide (TPR) repeat protein
MDRKTKLLALLHKAAAEEQDFMDALNAEERARQGEPDAWAPKDVIAHFATWEAYSVEQLRRLLEGEPLREEDEDDDTENARIFAERREWSWDEVRAYALAAKADYEQVLLELDEAQLDDPERGVDEGRPLWRTIVSDVYTHPLIHVAEHYRDAGDLERAAEIVGRMTESAATLDDSPEWEGLTRYNTACSYALLGKIPEAIAELSTALKLNPGLRDWSRQDTDLVSLHGRPEYEALYA